MLPPARKNYHCSPIHNDSSVSLPPVSSRCNKKKRLNECFIKYMNKINNICCCRESVKCYFCHYPAAFISPPPSPADQIYNMDMKILQMLI